MSFETIRLTLWEPAQAHRSLMEVWTTIKPWIMAGHRLQIEVKAQTRSLEQNARLWAMLTDVSRQVDWYGQKLTPEEWKDVFSAALRQQKVVPGIENGKFVVLGQRTSQMTRAQMTELQDFMEAFGAERGVRFTAPQEAMA